MERRKFARKFKIENTVRNLGIDVEDVLALPKTPKSKLSAPRLWRGADLATVGTLQPFVTQLAFVSF